MLKTGREEDILIIQNTPDRNINNVNNIKTNIIKSTERLIDSKQNSIDTVTPKQAINAILNKLLINF